MDSTLEFNMPQYRLHQIKCEPSHRMQMGSSFIAMCEICDLEAHGLIGGGMESFVTFAAWPCLCKSCKNITTANTLAASTVCLRCTSANVMLYDNPSLSIGGPDNQEKSGIRWGRLSLDTGRRYFCPHCESYAVVFQEGYRNWD